LSLNEFSWNKVANVIFLESPAGVGFSGSNFPEDYVTGDQKTTNDTLTFLLGWYQKFPERRANRLFWSGESYSGHYTVLNAAATLEWNHHAPAAQKINLEGFLVGNPWTDPSSDNSGCVADWWSHALISTEVRDGLLQNCNFGDIGPLRRDELSAALGNKTELCNSYVDEAMKSFAIVNIYDIYQDACVSSLQHKTAHRMMRARFGRHLLKGGIAPQPTSPCIDNWTEAYFNQPSVISAIHARLISADRWDECSDEVDYSYKDVLTSVVPVYQQKLLNSGLRMLVYSGDVDAIVPTTGTRTWLEQVLRVTVTKPWRSYIVNKQVGGFVEEYEGGLSFATVRGAGHMVPSGQAERSLYVLQQFLAGQPL
jgi:serine carboxypeptidase-like clade 2